MHGLASRVMFPVKVCFVRSGNVGDDPIGLKFNVEEFGGIKPWSGFIGRFVTTDRLCDHFPHHPCCIPYLLYVFPALERIRALDTVTNRINIRDVRFKISIDEV